MQSQFLLNSQNLNMFNPVNAVHYIYSTLNIKGTSLYSTLLVYMILYTAQYLYIQSTTLATCITICNPVHIYCTLPVFRLHYMQSISRMYSDYNPTHIQYTLPVFRLRYMQSTIYIYSPLHQRYTYIHMDQFKLSKELPTQLKRHLLRKR